MNKDMLSGLFFGLTTIVAIVFASSFVISLLMKFTLLNEASFTVTTMVISFAALFVGGLISGTKARRRGLFIGAGTGLLYGLIVYLIQYLGFDKGFSMEQYLYFAAYILVAALGGMLGVYTMRKNIKV